jgi:DNA-binding transcriptional regulator LsrR (DeoR family)
MSELSTKTQIRVLELYNEGFSRKEISKLLNISRSSVGRVVSRGYVQHRSQTKVRKHDSKDLNLHLFDEGKFERCPNCGGLVIMPCLKCRIEKRIAVAKIGKV